jgi:hypothetical protein
MLKLFFTTLFLVLLSENISFAQGLKSFESDINRNNKENFEYIHPLDYNKKSNVIIDKKNEQKTILADDVQKVDNALKLEDVAPIVKAKNTKKTNEDGLGIGFRVYDNSNRQSYFCGLNQAVKPKFSHDNNFNGVYFGVAINSISSAVDFSLKSVGGGVSVVGGKIIDTTSPNFFQNFSGANTLPSIIIGQGRLFSNGLFLGQEASINIGEFSASKKNILVENVNLDEVKMFSSNFSTYSGKFGYNIFKNFLPYVKISMSLSPIKYLIKVDQNSDVNRTRYLTVGDLPNIGFGTGIDISLYEHVRMMIDYTYFPNSSGKFDDTLCLKDACTSAGQSKRPEMTSSFSVAKVGVVWRF